MPAIRGSVAFVPVAALMLLGGCGSIGVEPAPLQPSHTYTCCPASAIDTVYHPGETLSLNWIVEPTMVETLPAPGDVTLEATLYGPYESEEDVKAHPHSADSMTAPPIHPDVIAGEAASSQLEIPADAAPGYYNVRFTMHLAPDGVSGGDSVIRIE